MNLINQRLYAIFIFLTILFTYFNIYFETWNKIYFYIPYMLILYILLIYKKFKKFEIKKIILLLLPIMFIRQYIVTYIIALAGYKIKDKIKIIIVINSLFYTLTIILYKLGISLGKYKDSFRYIDGIKYIRSGLGFNHPNQPMTFLFIILSGVIYLYFEKNRIKVLIGCICASTYIYTQTNSRTIYYTLIFIYFLLFIKNKYLKKIKYISIPLVLFFPLSTYIFSMYFFNTKLDLLFSRRLSIYHLVFTEKIGKITLFGNFKEASYALDNAYVNVFYKNGIIGLGIYMIILFFIIKILLENKDYIALKLFLGMMIYGFMEKDILFYYFNIIIYILPRYILKKYKLRGRKYEDSNTWNQI